MNEKRFIQLVNLQIDGEISESELQELEREIASDPDREAVYQSYRRLQEASELVSSQFGAALSETVDLKKYQMLARDSENWRRGFFYSVGALTAACVAVAAAVGFFPNVEWSSATVRMVDAQEPVAVEVYEPGAISRSRAKHLPMADAPDLLPFANFRFSSGSISPSTQFRQVNGPAAWSSSFSAGSAPGVIYNNTSFEGTAPVLIEFTR